MSELNEVVSSNLKKLRAKTTYKASEVAEAIGVSQATVTSWENGLKIPRQTKWKKIADFYGVSVDDIFSLKTPDERSKQLNEDDLVDFDHLLNSKTRLVFGGKVLSQKEKAITKNLVKAVVITDEIYETGETESHVVREKPFLYEVKPDNWESIMKLKNYKPYEPGNGQMVPIIRRAAAGTAIYDESNFSGMLDLPSGYSSNDGLFYLIVDGESMLPYIPDGALALFEMCDDVPDGKIAAVRFEEDDSASIKYVYHEYNEHGHLERLRFESSNPDPEYKPFYSDEENPAFIEGRLLEIRSIF